MSQAFATLKPSTTSGFYLSNKKGLMTYCSQQKNINCKKSWSQGLYMAYNAGSNIVNGVAEANYNTSNLQAGLFTSEDLREITVLENAQGKINNNPRINTNSSQPFYSKYVLDPKGQLFGTTTCNSNEYLNYLVPSLQLQDVGEVIYNYIKTSCFPVVKYGQITEMACDDTGYIIIAPSVYESGGPYFGTVSISINGGKSWVQYFPDGINGLTDWSSCTCSNDGSIILAGTGFGAAGGSPEGNIYITRNYGGEWFLFYSAAASYAVLSLASSKKCDYVFGGFYNSSSQNSYIATFDISGNLLYTSPPISGFREIVCSESGQHVFLVCGTSGSTAPYIYYSNNYGQSFTPSVHPSSSTNRWESVACSKSGKYVYAGELKSGNVYFSDDYGKTFYLLTEFGNEHEPQSIACDKTGNVVTIAFQNTTSGVIGGIYQNANVLQNLSTTTPIESSEWTEIGTSAEIPNHWTAVTCSSSGYNLAMSTTDGLFPSPSEGVWTYNAWY